MAHFELAKVSKPTHFNFAQDVVDYWASKPKAYQAMLWVSEDLKDQRDLSYAHFSRQSNRIATLFETLGVGRGDVILLILPKLPEW
jgi:acyl-coenzyme A synthetase/AMP-(fatty) acid ligase